LQEAVEARAALRNIFALDDFVGVRPVANASAEIHADAQVSPLIHGASVDIEFPRGHRS
jgi:hypothetical protein